MAMMVAHRTVGSGYKKSRAQFLLSPNKVHSEKERMIMKKPIYAAFKGLLRIFLGQNNILYYFNYKMGQYYNMLVFFVDASSA